MPESAASLRRRIAADGSSAVFITVDGSLAGALVMVDPVRSESPEALRMLSAPSAPGRSQDDKADRPYLLVTSSDKLSLRWLSGVAGAL